MPRLLIVDDVFDTGLSIDAVIDDLAAKARRNTPGQIKIATTYFKPANNKTQRAPDYYVHETDKWLVLPWELDGLSEEEVFRHRPFLRPLFEQLEARRKPESPRTAV